MKTTALAVRSNLPCLEIEKMFLSSRNEIKSSKDNLCCMAGWVRGSTRAWGIRTVLRVVSWTGPALVWEDRAVGMGTDPHQGCDISSAGRSSLENL